MAKGKVHFDFDAFMNKIDTALLLAQKASHHVDNGDDLRCRKSVSATVSKLRELRAMIDEPLVWFKMEKGTTYRQHSKANWKKVD